MFHIADLQSPALMTLVLEYVGAGGRKEDMILNARHSKGHRPDNNETLISRQLDSLGWLVIKVNTPLDLTVTWPDGDVTRYVEIKDRNSSRYPKSEKLADEQKLDKMLSDAEREFVRKFPEQTIMAFDAETIIDKMVPDKQMAATFKLMMEAVE